MNPAAVGASQDTVENQWRLCLQHNRAAFKGLNADEIERARKTFYAGALSALMLLDGDLGLPGDHKPVRRLINRRITETNKLIMMEIIF